VSQGGRVTAFAGTGLILPTILPTSADTNDTCADGCCATRTDATDPMP
jgi:hypothetical protein